jgi:Cu/Ag efflux protein CusF
MRNLTLFVCAAFVAGLVLAQIHPVSAAVKTHDVTGTVVSVDIEAKKITFKDDSDTSLTLPVLDKAMESLKTVKAEDKVTLTCQDNEQGDHEGVSAIMVAKTTEESTK